MNNTIAAGVYLWMRYFDRQNQRADDHLDAVLQDAADAGYNAIEGWLSWFGEYGTVERYKKAASATGITCVGAYLNARLHEVDRAEAAMQKTVTLARVAADYGCTYINVNPEPINWKQPTDKSDAELQIQAESLNRLAVAIDNMGLRLTVHHHDMEMRQDAKEFKANLLMTNRDTVYFCMDPDWVAIGGQDPVALLQDTAPRLGALHLRNNRAGKWTDCLSDGDVDYHTLKAVLDKTAYAGPLVVELIDPDDNPWERSTIVQNLHRAREEVETLFGA